MANAKMNIWDFSIDQDRKLHNELIAESVCSGQTEISKIEPFAAFVLETRQCLGCGLILKGKRIESEAVMYTNSQSSIENSKLLAPGLITGKLAEVIEKRNSSAGNWEKIKGYSKWLLVLRDGKIKCVYCAERESGDVLLMAIMNPEKYYTGKEWGIITATVMEKCGVVTEEMFE